MLFSNASIIGTVAHRREIQPILGTNYSRVVSVLSFIYRCEIRFGFIFCNEYELLRRIFALL